MRIHGSGASRLHAAAIFSVAALTWAGAASAASVRAEPYGRTKEGAAVTAYTLTNVRGNSATILDMGATIAAVRVPDRDGRRTNVVLSYGDVAGWEAQQHANAILGRVANRIMNGFTLDGVHYPLRPGPTGQTMHSATGYTGYGLRLWQVEPVRRRDGAAISMTLQSPDGDQGMPGNLKIRATYRFTNDNALRLDMTATTDKATPVNLTNHIYFNLGGATTAPVYDHLLQVNSQEIAGAPEIGVVGQLRPVAATPFDLTRPVRLGDRMALALGPQYAPAATPPGATPPPIPATMIRVFNLPYSAANSLDKVAAVLSDPVSGRVVEVRTVEPSVHIYALPRTPAGARSDTGAPFPPRARPRHRDAAPAGQPEPAAVPLGDPAAGGRPIARRPSSPSRPTGCVSPDAEGDQRTPAQVQTRVSASVAPTTAGSQWRDARLKTKRWS